MGKIKGILIDFDGTLVNTNEVIIASWQHTYKHYLGYEVEEQRIISCFGEPLLETMAREFPNADVDEACEIYRNYQRDHAEEYVVAFKDIDKMLKALKEKGYKICIVTSRTKESTKRYIDFTGIGGVFDDIVACEDTEEHKPSPAPILEGIRRIGLNREELLMVGDGVFDLGAAKGAGVKSVLVGWKITENNKLKGEVILPDYEINEPMDLVDLVDSI